MLWLGPPLKRLLDAWLPPLGEPFPPAKAVLAAPSAEIPITTANATNDFNDVFMIPTFSQTEAWLNLLSAKPFG
jgi:hypothetical protein